MMAALYLPSFSRRPSKTAAGTKIQTVIHDSSHGMFQLREAAIGLVCVLAYSAGASKIVLIEPIPLGNRGMGGASPPEQEREDICAE